MNFDIEKLKRKILIKYPNFATIITNMKFIPSESCLSNGQPTCATDGENFIYHPDYMTSIDEDIQAFVFAHEVSHIAFDHIKRSKDKDPETWNIATDAVINAFLKRDGLKLDSGSVEILGAENFDSETLYNMLLQEKQNNPDNSSANNSNNNQNDVGHDTHKMWEDAIKKEQEQSNSNIETNETKKEENSKLDEKEIFENNKEKREENLRKLRDELAKQSASCSKGNDKLSEYIQIENIGNGSSLIDWRKRLKNSVNSKIDWSYKNATIEDGVVTSHLEILSNPETEILLDTSGSINSNLLRNFLKECKSILNTSNMKVGCFDDKFYGFTEIKRESDIDNMIFQGRGGTDFDVAVNSFTKRVDNRIIFTDGEATMPEIALDVIWVVFGDTKINPKGGKVIYIDEKQLEELNLYKEESKGRTR